MDEKKVLLNIQNVEVKFRVRGRTLTAIRGASLDIYENESIAIVGESGSGKSVFTKTFAGMLDDNGYISQGRIVFNDPELADTKVKVHALERSMISHCKKKLDEYSKLEAGAAVYNQMEELKKEHNAKQSLSPEEEEALTNHISDLTFEKTELFNYKQTLDPSKEKAEIRATTKKISQMEDEIKALEKKKKDTIRAHKDAVKNNAEYMSRYQSQLQDLQKQYAELISGGISEETQKRNEILAKEIVLSVDRYAYPKNVRLSNKLLKAFKKAMTSGVDLMDQEARNEVFDEVAFRVRYLDETEDTLHGTCILNLANVKYAKDWSKIRGGKIATVFQDPMTSLNPILTIGKQITSIIMKHQGCSEMEARIRALELMNKVGIPNAEHRFDDYPFQYSGGMRQRIVIAIALSCQPKILICDEPTTALDVTIQAQILQLLKDLQKEFGFTIVFITHDLGVVANVADRVAVLYAGQIVELGSVEEVFYDPRHPYTWALLSSMPQLAQKNTKLYSITGTPPSLYNKIVGDPFAPRNPYCLKIDTLEEPPMFQVTDTHYAKTWLLDPRAPKIEKPEIIQDIHGKLVKAFNI